MNKLVEISAHGSTILIESIASEDPKKIVQAGGVEKKLEKRLSDLVDVIRPIAESVVESVERINKRPDKVTTEFGLSLTAEGNIFVVKAAGEASLKITFEWGND